MPALVLTTFKVGTQSYRGDEWIPFKTASNGKTVYISTGSFGDGGGHKYLIPYLNGATYEGPAGPAQVNVYLKDPVTWERLEGERRIRAKESGSVFHSIVKSVSKAIKQTGNVVVDTAEFGLTINRALLQPLKIDDGGLQLTHYATDGLKAVGASDDVINAAQLVTKIGGYGVLAGAAVTAVGGISGIQAIGETVSSGVGVVKGAYSAYETIAGVLTPIAQPQKPSLAAPRNSPSMVGPLIAVGIVGVVFLIAVSQRG